MTILASQFCCVKWFIFIQTSILKELYEDEVSKGVLYILLYPLKIALGVLIASRMGVLVE